ncbi:hypothetical protein MTR_8g099595 [Medicago truncatula]|uniref:Uncharacterized protein n=1 Tax=Medicago truncatula TaxID=3880 RepID=A0A072TUP2_MEDTR|nr:hypothetical protein MTR_8g099595 [Medicago truncatula]
MANKEDARERRIREGRVRKGKPAMTNSVRKEMEVEHPCVPKTRRRRDLRIGGGDGSGSHSQMDYSSQVVDPTSAHDKAVYEEGFVGYDRMEEDIMFYPPQDEAEDEEVPDDVVADYLEAENIILEGEPEPQTQRRRRRIPPIPPYLVGGPPFP